MNNKEAIERLLCIKEKLKFTNFGEALNLAIKALEERPTGEWEEPFTRNGKTYHRCTKCHVSSELILIDRFCPNCGARMR